MRLLAAGLGLGAALLLAACGDGAAPPPTNCAQPGFDCDITLTAPSVGMQLKVGPFPVSMGTSSG